MSTNTDTTQAAPPSEGSGEVKPEVTPKIAETKVTATVIKDEEKPAEPEKQADGTPKATTVPEKYDLKLPEGSLLDQSALESFASAAKTEGLTQEQAQARLERDSALIASYAKEQQAKLESVSQGEWIKTIEADKEIGGTMLKKSVEDAKRVIQRYGSPSLIKDLNASGLGNHPEFVRLMARIGKAMSEDQLIVPGSQVPKTEKSIEEIFYGSTTPTPTT